MELDPLYCDVIVQRYEQFTREEGGAVKRDGGGEATSSEERQSRPASLRSKSCNREQIGAASEAGM